MATINSSYITQGQTTTGVGIDTSSVARTIYVENNKNHGIHLIHKGAAASHATALVFNIEGSNDGTNWAVLSTTTASAPQLAADNTYVALANYPIGKIRINITTLTWATSGTVDGYYLGTR